MKRTLTVVSVKELPEGWRQDFPFEALSVKPTRKLLLRERAPLDAAGHPLAVSGGWVNQIAEAQALVPPGVEVHVWEWFPARTPAQGKAFGERMGKLCAKHGIKRFKINAESEWAGVEKFPPTSEPYATLFEFVAQFYIWAPEDCELWFNGFSWSRTSDGRKLYDADLLKAFKGRLVMTHGTNRASLLKSGRDKLSKWPGITVVMQMGVGRRDKDGTTWGFWNEYKTLIREFKFTELDWYMGNGAKSRYFEDTPEYPALVKCAREFGP